MKYTIDSEICKKHGISLGAVLYLLTLVLNEPITQDTVKEAWRLGAIMSHKTLPNGDIVSVTLEKKGAEIVGEILSDSTYEPTNENRFVLLAEKLRELYPKGKKEGTAYMWRDSNSVIAKRLETLSKKLIKETGKDFTDEQAISATERYIATFNGQYTYMQLLKYFISKRTVVDGTIEETSQLLSYIENEGQDDVTPRDWVDRVV